MVSLDTCSNKMGISILSRNTHFNKCWTLRKTKYIIHVMKGFFLWQKCPLPFKYLPSSCPLPASSSSFLTYQQISSDGDGEIRWATSLSVEAATLSYPWVWHTTLVRYMHLHVPLERVEERYISVVGNSKVKSQCIAFRKKKEHVTVLLQKMCFVKETRGNQVFLAHRFHTGIQRNPGTSKKSGLIAFSSSTRWPMAVKSSNNLPTLS